MNDDDDNVVTFGAIQGGKKDADKNEGIPENDYIIVDMDDNEFPATGFLLFTSHHIAIMQDRGSGPVPVLVLPLVRVKASWIDDEVDDSNPELF